MGCWRQKKSASAANLWEVGDFCVDYNPDNTAIAIDRGLLGIGGLRGGLRNL